MDEDVMIGRRRAITVGALGAGAVAALASTRAEAQDNAGGTTLQAIRDSGKLRIGAAHGEPWFSKDQRSGEWSGIGWAVGVAIAQDLGVEPVAVETSWGNAVAALQADQFDVMFVLDATPQRALAVDFPVQPMFYYAQGLLVQEDVDASQWQGLNRPDFTVGVILGTSPDRDVTARLGKATIERFPNADELTAAFQAGRVQGISLFHPALVMQQRRVRKGKVVLPQPFRASTTSAGVRPEPDKSWRDWLGLTMDYYYQTGATQRFYEEYLQSRDIDAGNAPAIVREMWTQKS